MDAPLSTSVTLSVGLRDNAWPWLMARWPWLAACAACLLAAAGRFGDLVVVWETDGAYAHGYAVAAAALALLLRDAPRGARGWPALLAATLALAACTLLWALGEHSGVVTLGSSAAVLAWWLCCLALARGTLQSTLAPGLLLLAAPIWNLGVPLLQQLTIAANAALLGLFDIPALVVGDAVQLPAGSFVIEGGCAGLRFQLAALTLIAAIGLWQRLALPALCAWAAGAVLLALALNQLRVFAIILIGNATGMQSALVDDHAWFGWLLFLAVFTPYIALLQRRAGGVAAPAPGRDAETVWLSWSALIRSLSALTLSLLALCAVPLWLAQSIATAPGAPQLPAPAAGWSSATGTDVWRPQLAAPRYAAAARYRAADGGEVELYLAGYTRVAGADGLFASGGARADDLRWRIAGDAEALAASLPWPLRAVRLADGAGRQRLAMWWYEVGAARRAGAGATKLAALEEIAAGRATDARLLAASAACAGDCRAAAARLGDFVARHLAPATDPAE